MPAFSAVSGFLGAKKQADAAEDASDAQINYARESRDLAFDEADSTFDGSNRITGKTADRLRFINRQNNKRQGKLIKKGFNQQLGVYNALRSDLVGDGGFEESPGYQFRVNEAMDAVQASAAARGNLFSGATGTALQDRANSLAGDEWDRYRGDLKYLSEAKSGIYDWGTAANMNRANAFADTRSGITSGVGDTKINALRDRSNIKIGAGTRSNSTIGNALSDKAYGVADAWETGINGVTQGVNNGFKLFGAFG